MKYCIGCVHLVYQPKETAGGSEETGSWTVEPAGMFCQQGHWKEAFPRSEGPLQSEFAAAMEKAETCPDFCERQTP